MRSTRLGQIGVPAAVVGIVVMMVVPLPTLLLDLLLVCNLAGGGFDALDVTDLDGTVSPAAVLQCGIPVGRLEGRPATPLLWASRLAPRLAG